MKLNLPKDLGAMKPKNKYINSFPKGDFKIRMVSDPITGWEYWENNVPYRFSPKKKPNVPKQPNSKDDLVSKWWVYIWDYAQNDLFILSIKQKTVTDQLISLFNDPDWGNWGDYDIKITKSGEGKTGTVYEVKPMVPSPLSPTIKAALAKSPVRLEALYEGGDPWTDLVGDEDVDLAEASEICAEPSQDMTPFEQLQELLALDSIDNSRLQEYIDDIAARKKKAPSVAMEGMLLPEMRTTFKEHYQKWIKAVSQKSA